MWSAQGSVLQFSRFFLERSSDFFGGRMIFLWRGCMIFFKGCMIFCVVTLRDFFYVERLREFLWGEVVWCFWVQRFFFSNSLTHEVAWLFCVEMLPDFFWGSMIFVVERLCDFFEGCLIFLLVLWFFVERLRNFLWRACMIFFVERLHDFFLAERLRDSFVESLRDFVCGKVAWYFVFVCGGCVIFLWRGFLDCFVQRLRDFLVKMLNDFFCWRGCMIKKIGCVVTKK